MSLPIAKVTPTHIIKIPSTGKEHKMRGYLVHEEKTLMVSFESENTAQIMNALVDVIGACIADDVDVTGLTMFDLEFLFMQLRAVSVGETVEGRFNCLHCEVPQDVIINLSDASIGDVDPTPPVIKLDDDISVHMKYPTVKDCVRNKKLLGKDAIEARYESLLISIDKIVTTDAEHRFSDYTRKEREAFINAFSAKQFKPVQDFVDNLPSVNVNIEYDCLSCGETNKRVASGLKSLFISD